MLFCLIMIAILIFSSIYIYRNLASLPPKFQNTALLYTRTSIIVILLAAGLLNFFSRIKPFHNKLINKISSCVFGVYLIHDNNYIRPVLWKFVSSQTINIAAKYFIPTIMMVVLTIFVVCALIEFIRQNTFEKLFFKIFKKQFNELDNLFVLDNNKN